MAAQVGQFALAGLIALTIVGLATSIASRRIGEREGIADARTNTVITATGLVEPLVTDALVAGDAGAAAKLDRVIRSDVLDGDLVRVKVWTANGTIVYADERRLIGEHYELGEDERGALRTGAIEAEVSDLSKPENRYERTHGRKLLEVYLPIHTETGKPVLFEAYYAYDSVQASGTRLWRSFAPITLGALIALELVQIPLAWSLAHRLRLRSVEREGLLKRALEASEVERRQIASDLHDGVVQDLAGVAYGLSAQARVAEAPDEAQLEAAAATVRGSVRALRSLVIDLYPPNLREEGIESALRDLVERSSVQGTPITLDASSLHDPLPEAVARLLYRAAQEGVRNAVRHADAASILVRVATEDRTAVIEVVDDGRGFGDDELAEREADGHVGIRALRGLVFDAGGSLTVTSALGSGTTLRTEVPLP